MGEEALNLPSPAVAPELPTILGLGLFAVSAVRRNHLGAKLCQLGVQRVAVISSVAYETPRCSRDVSRCESLLYQGDFMRASRRKVEGEASTSSV